MGISTAWKSTKAGKKKTRPAYKPKIRWELLGLSDPEATESNRIDTLDRIDSKRGVFIGQQGVRAGYTFPVHGTRNIRPQGDSSNRR